jgi:Asp-tRNA(Asn)/Glu-tRNA(Gln) amidotransferase A subunit family amidase
MGRPGAPRAIARAGKRRQDARHRRTGDRFIEALERALANGRPVCGSITSWENRWSQRPLVDASPGKVSERAQNALRRAEAMSVDDDRAALLARDTAQLVHRAMAPLADGIITMACPGPATPWAGDVPVQPLHPRPTGDFVFNAPSSMLFAPAVTERLMGVAGLPPAVQVMGQQNEDTRATGRARWLWENIVPVVA